MPLSKARKVQYMRDYRATKKAELGSTHPENTGKRNTVIPKTFGFVPPSNNVAPVVVDADGNRIWED